MAGKYDVPVISDGGIKHSGDITKAIAAGAHSVMMGGLFAGTEESPGETVLYQGRTLQGVPRAWARWAPCSPAGRASATSRTPRRTLEKLVPEGIEGRVPYKGALSALVYQLVGGLRAGMGYCGCRTSRSCAPGRFVRLTNAGLRESHVHDVIITKEAPNYRIES